MAATGYTPISLYYSTTAAAVPTSGNLVSGELAINITDGKLYYKNNSGTVTLLATAGATSSQWTTTGSNIYYNTGNVGIGTSSPTAKLQIGDATVATSNRIVFGKAIASSESFLPAIGQQSSSGVGNDLALAATSSSGVVRFYTGASTNSGEIGTGSNTEKMRLDSAGNLGIGTSSPKSVGNYIFVTTNATTGSGYTTYVNGTEASNFYANASATVIQEIRALPLVFETNATERARIDSSGNLGVGTASPVAKFDLAGDYKEGVVTANSSTAYTISLATGTVQILTLTGNATFTMPSATAGKSFIVYLKTGAGSYTATFTSVKWAGGTAPTVTATAARQDIYSFFADGTNWYGVTVGQNYTP